MTFIERQRQRRKRRQGQGERHRYRLWLRLLARMACRQVATIVKCCLRERLLIESVSRVPEGAGERSMRKAEGKGKGGRESRATAARCERILLRLRSWIALIPPADNAIDKRRLFSSFFFSFFSSSCSSHCVAMSFVVFSIRQWATKARHLLMKPCGSQSNVEPKALTRRLIALPWHRHKSWMGVTLRIRNAETKGNCLQTSNQTVWHSCILVMLPSPHWVC